ncbi:MAG: ion transporter [Saprospiraceae bacterium]|nr:ion transporter [Saprospiraceae bacterium]
MIKTMAMKSGNSRLRERLHEIIFEADTWEGKLFDLVIMALIVISTLVVIIESVDWIGVKFGRTLYLLEWGFTAIFTLEFLLRLYTVKRPMRYVFSFFGFIDLLSVIPAYVGLIIPGAQSLIAIRALRLIRIFRVFKLGYFLKEGFVIVGALRASRAKITVFLTFILLSIIVIGAIMYLVEGGMNDDFSSIPKSMYWAIVTLTTVGYGDITPITGFGQFLSALVMIMGYAVIAVPTGIVSSELIQATKKVSTNTQACPACSNQGHDDDANFCKYCGSKLHEVTP